MTYLTMEDINERLKMLLVIVGEGNVMKWANRIGINQSTLNKRIRGEQKLSIEQVQKILEAHENISAEWFVMGRGPIFRDLEREILSKRPAKSRTKKEKGF